MMTKAQPTFWRHLPDAFLMHNRPIRTRCDDSVVRVIHSPDSQKSSEMPLRRSRGYAPYPRTPTLGGTFNAGCGGRAKEHFLHNPDRYAFLSHHIGDLQNYENP